jgi:hypothetical protein
MTRRKIPAALILFCSLILICFHAAAVAQTTAGSVFGVVADRAGAVIPGAKVVAESDETGQRYTGVHEYTPDQIKVEPDFSPANEVERRALLQAEAQFIKQFEYGDAPGYAVIKVGGARVTANLYAGAAREPWRRLDLSALLAEK